jgi:hypothetical protein
MYTQGANRPVNGETVIPSGMTEACILAAKTALLTPTRRCWRFDNNGNCIWWLQNQPPISIAAAIQDAIQKVLNGRSIDPAAVKIVTRAAWEAVQQLKLNIQMSRMNQGWARLAIRQPADFTSDQVQGGDVDVPLSANVFAPSQIPSTSASGTPVPAGSSPLETLMGQLFPGSQSYGEPPIIVPIDGGFNVQTQHIPLTLPQASPSAPQVANTGLGALPRPMRRIA